MKINPLMLVVFFFFVMVTSLSAAIPGMGLKCGFTIANQKFTYTNSSTWGGKDLTGLTAGVFTEFFTEKTVSLVAELDYIQKGFVEEYTYIVDSSHNGSEIIEENYRFGYLSTPLYIKFTYRKPIVTPYILIGCRFDYLVSRVENAVVHDKIFNNFKDYDVGGSFGIGGQYRIAHKLNILLEGRYSPAAGCAYKTDLLKVTNLVYEIIAGVQF